MESKAILEEAYSFLHQKLRVYEHSSDPRQRDDIEYAVTSFVNSLGKGLRDAVTGGDENFLFEHDSFEKDMRSAVSRLEKMIDDK